MEHAFRLARQLGVTLSMVFALWTVGYQIADFMRPH
jgi:hypothetical protein